MAVFEQGPRIDTRPPFPKESAFAYLNRGAGPGADAARGRIEAWLDRYPRPAALAARLRSPREDHHLGAFFELLLHALLLARGHRILAIEPKLAHTWKAPDFLVEAGAGDRFYLEAISAGQVDLHTALKRKANRYGALDLPLVVAVNCREDESAIAKALLGTDGLWQGPRGPQRRVLSAVLAIERADPWTLAGRQARLFRHPAPDHPLPAVDFAEGLDLQAALR